MKMPLAVLLCLIALGVGESLRAQKVPAPAEPANRLERITRRPAPTPATNDPGATNVVAGANTNAAPAANTVLRPVPGRGAPPGATTPAGQVAPPFTTRPTPAANVATPVPPGLTPGATPAPAQAAGAVAPATGGADLAVAPAASAGDNSGLAGAEDPVKVLNFNNAPLDQVLEYYANLTGRTILRPAVLNGNVTIKTQSDLTRAEAVQALNSVLALNGITMINVGTKFTKAVLQAQSLQEAAAFSTNSASNMPESDQFVTQLVRLKNAKPTEVVPALTPFAKNAAGIVGIDTSQIIVLRDYASNVKRMLEIIEKVDVVQEMDYKLEVLPIRYGKVEDIYNTMSSLISGQGGGTTSPRSSRTTGAARSGGFGTAALQQSRQPNQGAAAMNQPAASQNSFQNRLNQIVNRAAQGGTSELLTDAKIIPDERSNSLIVFANKQDLVMITNIINKVDVALAQVLIEAIVMEVSLDSGRQLGVSYLQKPHSSGQFTGAGGFNNGTPFLNPNNFISTITGTNGTSTTSNVGIPNLPGGLSYFGTFGNSFDVAMTAVATDSTVNVISRPRIMTSHAVPGSFFVGNTVPYITGTSYGYGGVSDIYGGNRSSYTQLSVGIQLDVVPFITPDGLVVMEIQQNIEQLGTAVKIDGNDVPTTVRRQANATISVRDRDTIMLGGFINADNTKSTSGVPMLKDIPYLGALFRSKTDNKRRTELVVLMRPTVLQKPEQAAIFAREETSRMYGIRQAQDENEREEAARNEKLKKDINKVRK